MQRTQKVWFKSCVFCWLAIQKNNCQVQIARWRSTSSLLSRFSQRKQKTEEKGVKWAYCDLWFKNKFTLLKVPFVLVIQWALNIWLHRSSGKKGCVHNVWADIGAKFVFKAPHWNGLFSYLLLWLVNCLVFLFLVIFIEFR